MLATLVRSEYDYICCMFALSEAIVRSDPAIRLLTDIFKTPSPCTGTSDTAYDEKIRVCVN